MVRERRRVNVVTRDNVPTSPRAHSRWKRSRPRVSRVLERIGRPDRLSFGVPLVVAIVGFVVGVATLMTNSDPQARPATGLLGVGLLTSLLVVRREAGRWDGQGLALVGLCVEANVVFLLLPAQIRVWAIDDVIHRSLISGPLLVLLSVYVAAYAYRRLRGHDGDT